MLMVLQQLVALVQVLQLQLAATALLMMICKSAES
jgi:hypothetical protein